MKKIKIIISLFLIILFFLSMRYGLSTRLGWKDDTDVRTRLKENNLSMISSDIMEDESFLLPKEVKTFEKLYDLADVVVRVSIPENRKRIQYMECTLSQANVIDVYKGQVETDFISIFEPIYVKDGFVQAVGVYIYMEDNQDYILFLKKIKCSLYNQQSYVYLPTTTSLSKYACSGQEVVGKAYLRKEDGIEYSYLEVKKYDISTSKMSIIKQYEENSKQVERLLKREGSNET